MIFLSSRLFSKIPNFRSRYYHFSTIPPPFLFLFATLTELDDTASFKDWMFEGICFIRAYRIVVCFAEIVVFVVSLENSLQFHPCIFFPLVGFVFEEDFSGFGFRVCFFLFLFFFICALLRRIMNYNCWRVKHRAKENIWNNKWGTLRRCPSVVKCIQLVWKTNRKIFFYRNKRFVILNE